MGKWVMIIIPGHYLQWKCFRVKEIRGAMVKLSGYDILKTKRWFRLGTEVIWW